MFLNKSTGVFIDAFDCSGMKFKKTALFGYLSGFFRGIVCTWKQYNFFHVEHNVFPVNPEFIIKWGRAFPTPGMLINIPVYIYFEKHSHYFFFVFKLVQIPCFFVLNIGLFRNVWLKKWLNGGGS